MSLQEFQDELLNKVCRETKCFVDEPTGEEYYTHLIYDPKEPMTCNIVERRKCLKCNCSKLVEAFADKRKCCKICLEKTKERRKADPMVFCKNCKCEVKRMGWIGHITTIKHKKTQNYMKTRRDNI